MSRDDVAVTVVILVVLASIIGGLLIGQHLRTRRAMLVETQPFGVSVTPPNGYKCFFDSDEAEYSYTIVCEPWK